ncbi:E3 ubiquitin-protein ligase XIAP-like isoform X1 [Clavelina lepadiformis]|uniref:E3 ubiquitin-protein ligase XIAP-like isoform X1 n=1 Tax=Clavelina lepadiformis TaxID=159417 RepID=UPI004042195D
MIIIDLVAVFKSIWLSVFCVIWTKICNQYKNCKRSLVLLKLYGDKVREFYQRHIRYSKQYENSFRSPEFFFVDSNSFWDSYSFCCKPNISSFSSSTNASKLKYENVHICDQSLYATNITKLIHVLPKIDGNSVTSLNSINRCQKYEPAYKQNSPGRQKYDELDKTIYAQNDLKEDKLFYTEDCECMKNYYPPNGLSGDPKHESFRLASFRTFPDTIPANPNMLARTGFFYIGDDDLVKCFSCSNVVSACKSSTPFDPSMHRDDCAFMKAKGGCGNVRIDQPDARAHIAPGVAQPAGDLFKTSSRNVDSTSYQAALPVHGASFDPPFSPQHQEITPTPLNKPLANVIYPNHLRLLRSLNLCHEVDRTKTFRNGWPQIPPRPDARLMARAGFFFLGNLDRVQCFSCGGVLRNWRGDDDPRSEHLTHFSNCKMAKGQETKNVPDNTPLPQVKVPSHVNFPLSEEEKRNLQIMFPCSDPVTPRMKMLHVRVQTFKNWVYTVASAYSIAEAGFFSLNVNDKVKCHYCNGGLQNWQRNDEPWEEHAKWYPTCEFLLQQRGPDYVHSIVSRFPNIHRPTLRAPGRDVPPSQYSQSYSNVPSTSCAPQIIDPQIQIEKERELLKEAMESDIAQTVIDMGYDEKLIEEIIKDYIEEHGKPYESAATLMDATLQYEEKMEEEKKQRERRELEQMKLAAQTNIKQPMDVSTTEGNFEQSFQELPGQALVANAAQLHDSTLSRFPEDKEMVDEAELERKLEQLIDERICKVCLDKEADVVFIPCGHICCCIECTHALRTCPICREKIEKALRTYMS